MSPTSLTQPAHRGSGARAALPVSLRGVGRTFATPTGPRTVLADVDLDLHAGEIVALIGPSGCGKSTLLRQVSRLDTPDRGAILVDGTPATGVDHRCAVAFQEPRLLPWRTLRQNVALGLPRGTPAKAGAERVDELLHLVGLDQSAGLRPRQVSGGMAQRAALARALARNPGVLLLDEPFGALDALTRLKMQDLLLEVHAAEPTTVLLVTHDVEEALYLADRVVLLGTPRREEPAGRLGPVEQSGQVPQGGRAERDGSGEARATGSVRRVIAVPGARPRDRASAELAELRAELLEGLGVDTHHTAHRPTDDRTDGRASDLAGRPAATPTRTTPDSETPS